MKRFSNKYINCILILISSILVGTLLLVCLYSIPTERARTNIKNSIEMYDENVIKTWNGNIRYGKLDTATDIYMINSAVSRKYDSSLMNAMLNPQFDIKDKTQDPQRKALIRALNKEDVEYSDYSRYWHGYSVYIIPGLYFFEIGELKTLIMCFCIIITSLVFVELAKKSMAYMLLFSIVVSFLNPVSIIMNFAITNVYFISIIAMYLVLKWNHYFIKDNRYICLFLIIGIFTSFFDFLTYPLVSWGLPIITLLLINKKVDISIFPLLVKISVMWCVGYIGMWAGKWCVASILTGVDVISNALNAFSARSLNIVENANTFSFFDVVSRQFEVFDRPIIVLMLLGISIIAQIIYKSPKLSLNSLFKFDVLILLLISISPLVWFFVAKNHVYYHPWYEYRNLAITLWALYCSFIKLVKRDN